MEFLTVRNISAQKGQDFTLHPISFTQKQGQKLAIAGATGSGKSTLLRIIGGLVQPDGGQVHFEGKRVLGPNEKLLPGNPGIGYLSQHFELRNNYTVAEELDYANQLPQPEAEAIYETCRISHLLGRGTHQLSGGEKQRIVTARLLTTRPRLLLLDEPFSNLDVQHRQVMKDMIRDIGERLNTSCILVSHEPLDTLSWADEIIVLQEGKMVQQGTPQQVYHHPVSSYVAGLFGSFQLLPAAVAQTFGVETSNSDQHLLVRPEYFSVDTNTEAGLPATVEHASFLGAYYELAVQVSGIRLNISCREHFIKGDTVWIRLNQQNNCWLPQANN